ncbi:gene transfer agent family protein [Sphingobium sufflavum]|uniref:gene transfer agent family protein n=1 Tax=Sphingobium sufflavum TaxID=1129547 RepID=UPI001F1D1C49|nr:gene transfer agent family protein [Sphingobium sufflavum]MCE7798647.1 gene transfer agent family protein [Sphingobium sufflavum]
MSGAANPVRGEVGLCLDARECVLRPSFAALVAAEGELGPLLALVDRAAEGRIALGEIAGLFWHCLVERGEWDREALGEAVMAAGLARVMPVVRAVLHQILAGTA